MYKKHQTPNSIINRTAYVWLRIKRERWVRGNANIYLWLKIIHKKIADHWLQIFHTEMAPTVCLSELPEARSPVVPFSRRLQRVSNGAIMKQQRLELRRIELNAANREVASLTPPDSPLWEAAYPHDFCAPSIVSSSSPIVSARVPADIEQQWKVFLARRKGAVWKEPVELMGTPRTKMCADWVLFGAAEFGLSLDRIQNS